MLTSISLRSISRWLSHFTMFGLGVGIAIVIMEVSLTVIELSPAWRVLPVVEAIMTGPDPDTGYAFLPNRSGTWVRENRARVWTNSHGMRSKEITLAKPDSVKRIVLLGDSYLEALQVENDQTFASRLEEKLIKGGDRVEVLNLGVSGTGPLLQLLHLKKYGLPFSPDIVFFMPSFRDFLGVQLENDSHYPAYVEDSDGELIIGRSYRTRFSQRYHDQAFGQLFLTMMQEFRVFRMAYARFKRGLMADQPKTFSVRSTPAPRCDTTRLEALHDLMRHDARDNPKKRRLDWFFSDVQQTILDNEVSVVFAMRGLDPIRQDCDMYSKMRDNLSTAVGAYLGNQGIGFVDLEQELQKRVGSEEAVKELRGFGLNRGHGGHLNYDGHEAYSRILSDVSSQILWRDE